MVNQELAKFRLEFHDVTSRFLDCILRLRIPKQAELLRAETRCDAHTRTEVASQSARAVLIPFFLPLFAGNKQRRTRNRKNSCRLSCQKNEQYHCLDRAVWDSTTQRLMINASLDWSSYRMLLTKSVKTANAFVREH